MEVQNCSVLTALALNTTMLICATRQLNLSLENMQPGFRMGAVLAALTATVFAHECRP